MSPRRRWAVLLTVLAVAGALALSERGQPPNNGIVAEVPKKARVAEPSSAAPASRTPPPAGGPVALTLRPSTEMAESPPQTSPATETGEAAARARAETPASGPMILELRPRQGATRIANSFAAHDWTPPPPRVKPVPPPPPTAPPLPYKVIGKKFEDGAWQVFLARQDQVFVVKPQDTLENIYRVEETKPPLMTLTYLPLQQRQTLSIGGVE